MQLAHSRLSAASSAIVTSKGSPQQAQCGGEMKVSPLQQDRQRVPCRSTAPAQDRQRGGRITSSTVRPMPARERDSDEAKLMASAVPPYAGPVKRPGSRTGRTRSGRCAMRRCLYIRGMDDRDIMTVFDRETVRRHRDRAAAGFPAYDFLFTEIAERLGDRLDDVVRDFPMALDLGCHTGQVGRMLGGRKGIETLVECDLSPAMVRSAGGGLRVAGDEELLPFANSSFDLAISNLSLHWVNDLPGALLQLRRALQARRPVHRRDAGRRDAVRIAPLPDGGGTGPDRRRQRPDLPLRGGARCRWIASACRLHACPWWIATRSRSPTRAPSS